MDERNGSETVDETVSVVEAAETGQAEELVELVQRGQAAKLAGVSRSTLWRLEHEGVLQPTETSPQGWALFRLEDVLAVRRARDESAVRSGRELVVLEAPAATTEPEPASSTLPGGSAPHALPPAELCAQVFDLFEAGHDGAAVVRSLRTVGPDQVLALRDKWLELKGAGVLLSPRGIQKLVSARLAVPRENAQGEPSPDTIQDEATLLEAIARALDTRQGLSGQRATSAADVTRWLSVRFVPGAEGQLLWLSATVHECGGESTVKCFRGEQWSSVEALARAVVDEAMHAQRTQEAAALGRGAAEMYTGNFPLTLETPHGVHRYWLSLETVAVGELARSLRQSIDRQRARRVKQKLEHDREQEAERKAKRKEAVKQRARGRREEAKLRAKERTEDAQAFAEAREAARAIHARSDARDPL
jgi:hypothetical protein